MNTAPALEPVKPNGGHFCTEMERLRAIQATQNKIGGEQTESRAMLSGIAGHIKDITGSMRELAEYQGVLNTQLVDLDGRVGKPSPDPLKPEMATGLVASVFSLAKLQAEHFQKIVDMRPRLDSLEEMGEITKNMSFEELVGRAKAAELRAERVLAERHAEVLKREEDLRAEEIKRAEDIRAAAEAVRLEAAKRAAYRRSLGFKIVSGITAFLTSAAGITWLAKYLH